MSQMKAEITQLTEKSAAMALAHENAQREHLAETQKLASMLRGHEDESSAEIERLRAKLDSIGIDGFSTSLKERAPLFHLP